MTAEERLDKIEDILYQLKEDAKGDAYWAYDLVIDLLTNDAVLKQYDEVKENE
ncbi:MAG: hypothetical protein M0Q88_00250 [Bacilli bacterium]|nr:hypothetical protein [Bacilli bacterium]